MEELTVITHEQKSPAKGKSVSLNVEGMTCTNCALSISKFLEKKGLKNVMVSFSTSEVRFSEDKNVDLPSVVKGIENLGYKVIQPAASDSHGHEHYRESGMLTLEQKFYISAIFSVPLLLHMFLPHSFLHEPYVQLALCIPVFAIGMFHFGKSAWFSLKSGVPNMDVLIAMGSSAAFIYSLTGTVFQLGPGYLFYETSAVIITLVLLGNVIEKRSVRKTTTAIEELGKLQPQSAKLIREGEGSKQESFINVNALSLRIGDKVLVNSGDKIPADGEVISGNGVVDESMISGESMPVEKKTGTPVIGGTILTDGMFRMKVNATGNEAVLSRIIELVKSAQQDKPSLEKFADKVSAVFVPVVVGIATVTFLVSFLFVGIEFQKALLNSIAVLVIACPCAMGLATPTAVMVGIGRVVKKGILIKGGSTLENFANIKNIVFDKTGTLTTGNFKIKEINTNGTLSSEEASDIIFSMEQHSSHPIAKSLVTELKGSKTMEFVTINEEKGLGLKAVDAQGNQYELGSYLMAKTLTANDNHAVYLVKNGQLAATIDMEDEIKPEAKDTIDYLKKQGVKTILLSGDKKEKCDALAGKLGIDEVYAEQLPYQKLEIINRFVKEAPTAMVGDGINDAPALAKANVGISLSNATQVAIQTSQIILLQGDLSYLKNAHAISRHTFITIKQNLFWALSYNVVAIPIAALGFLSPMVAAFSMAFSDVVVIGNSLRLRTKRIF